MLVLGKIQGFSINMLNFDQDIREVGDFSQDVALQLEISLL